MDKIYCKCGCGLLREKFTWGREKKYINGHNGKDFSKEIINRIRIGNLGRKPSENTKLKREQTRLLKNPIDIKYFDKMNSRNSYILGYLFADGCMRILKKTAKPIYRCTITSVDYELIEKYGKEFKMNLSKRIRKSITTKGKPQYHISIQIYSLLNKLYNLGLIPNKSKRIELPSIITNRLFFPFLRGFFDGDGCIRDPLKRKYPSCSITTCSVKFLKQIQNRLNNFGINSNIKKHKSSNCFILTFRGYKNVFKLYKQLYKSADNLFLSRKRDRFRQYFLNEKHYFKSNAEKENPNGIL